MSKNWQETVIKLERFKWKAVKLSSIVDDREDLVLRIPLGGMLGQQAKAAFASGIFSCIEWIVKLDRSPTLDETTEQMKAWGLDDFWQAILRRKKEASHE